MGREIVFCSQIVEKSRYTYDIGLVNSENERVEWESINNGNMLISSNSKMELYIDKGNHIYQHFPIREKTTGLGTTNMIRMLYFIVSNNIIKTVLLKESRYDKEIISDSIRLKLIHSKKGYLVPIPRWVDYVIRRLNKDHNTLIIHEIMSGIVEGKIYSEMLNPLRVLCNDIQSKD